MAEVVARSGIETRTVHVFNVGSTGVISCIEFEPGLAHDLPEMLDKLVPPSHNYGHEQPCHHGNGRQSNVVRA